MAMPAALTHSPPSRQFAADIVFIRACSKCNVNIRPVLALLGTSWVSSVLASRPFSNVAEGWCLVLALALALELRLAVRAGNQLQMWRCGSGLGVVTALGIFTRFTFPIFLLPIAYVLVLDLIYFPARDALVKRRSVLRCGRWLSSAIVIASGLASLALTSVAIAIIDSVFFGTLVIGHSASNAFNERIFSSSLPSPVPLISWIQSLAPVSISGHLVLTPFYSLQYNADPANLAAHGIHPRSNHALVNMHIMYGPVWTVVLTAGLVIAVSSLLDARQSKGTKVANRQQSGGSSCFTLHAAGPPSRHFTTLCAAIVISGIFFLSLAPHQEPRFLAPLVYPMAVLGPATFDWITSAAGPEPARCSKLLRRAWVPLVIVFNIILAFFYGLVHQAGVYPMSMVLSRTATAADVGAAGVNASSSHSLPLLRSGLLSHITVLDPEALAEAFDRMQPVQQKRTMGTDIIYVGTYMPPHALMLQPSINSTVAGGSRASDGGDDSSPNPWYVAPWCASNVHAGGSAAGQPQNSHWQGTVTVQHVEPSGLESVLRDHRDRRKLLVCPEHMVSEMVAGSARDRWCHDGTVAVEPLVRVWPHVSTEHWPPSVSSAALVACRISCTASGAPGS